MVTPSAEVFPACYVPEEDGSVSATGEEGVVVGGDVEGEDFVAVAFGVGVYEGVGCGVVEVDGTVGAAG